MHYRTLSPLSHLTGITLPGEEKNRGKTGRGGETQNGCGKSRYRCLLFVLRYILFNNLTSVKKAFLIVRRTVRDDVFFLWIRLVNFGFAKIIKPFRKNFYTAFCK
jgi:hypothetical protein